MWRRGERHGVILDKPSHLPVRKKLALLSHVGVLHAAKEDGVGVTARGARIMVGIMNPYSPVQNAMCKRWDTPKEPPSLWSTAVWTDSSPPPSGGRLEGGTHGRCPPPRTTACGTTPHLASPRWGEVPSHRTRWEAGDQVWRRVENLSQKSPKYLDTYFAPLPPGVGEGWDGGAEACSGVFAPPSPPP